MQPVFIVVRPRDFDAFRRTAYSTTVRDTATTNFEQSRNACPIQKAGRANVTIGCCGPDAEDRMVRKMKPINLPTHDFECSNNNASTKRRCLRAAAFLLAILLSGCGGSSGQATPAPTPTPVPITFQLIYPGQASLTDATRISVVGLADASRLTSVSIRNGSIETPASQDSAGRWRASDIPLAAGDNQLMVRLTENNGQVTEIPISAVRSSPILSYPTAALFDVLNQRVLILDPKQLLSFDLANNELAVVSGTNIGAGPDFGFARHFALDTDGAVIVANLRDIQRVDPVTGDRSEYVVLPANAGPIGIITVDQQLARLFAVGFFGDLYTADLSLTPPISATTIKPLPTFGFAGPGPVDGAFVPTTGSIYTVSISTTGVTEIDAANGDANFIMLNFGNFVTSTIGIDYDDVGSQLLVLGNSGAIFSLDPTTQASSLLFSPPATANPPVSRRSLSVGNDKLWTVVPVRGELRSIDKTAGSQVVEASSQLGDGAPLGPMLAGRYDAASQRLIIVADSRVIAIDTKTGSRELLAELFDPTQAPTQADLIITEGLVLSQDGARAWLADRFNQKIVEVDLNNGDVTTVTGPNVGAGPLPTLISGITIDFANNVAYVADKFSQRIFRIDLVSGERSEFATLPAEFLLSEIRSLVFDAVADRLLLNIAPISPASSIEPSIYAMDLVSRETTLIATLSSIELPRGQTTAPGSPTMQMSLSADAGTLYTPVSGNADIPFAQINLGTSVAEPLGTAASGVPFFAPNAIEVTPENQIFALDSSGAILIVDPESGERSIISK
jgi:hypothetical protein